MIVLYQMFNILTDYLLGTSTNQQISSSDDIQEKNKQQTLNADENEWMLVDRDDILTGVFSASGIEEEGVSCTLTNEAHTGRITANLIEYDSVNIDQHLRLTRSSHNSWSDSDSLSIEFSDGEHKLDEIIEQAQKVQSRKERRTLKHKRVNRKNKANENIKGTNIKT